MNWKQKLSIVRPYPLKVSCYNYKPRTKINLSEPLKFLKFCKKSERVIIKKDNRELCVDKVPAGLESSVSCLYDVEQQANKLYRPAFILILKSLKLDEQLAMNKYA